MSQLVSERAKGNVAVDQSDVCLKATDSINTFLPSDFDLFDAVPALSD